MKKITLSLVSLLMIVSYSFAQQEAAGTQDFKAKRFDKRKNNPKKMGEILQLTDSQKKQMKEFHQDYQKKIDDLNLQQNLTIKEYNDRKTALRKELIAKRQSVMTKEQKNRMETAKQLRELKKKEMLIKTFGKMREKLDLSDDQVNQMKVLNEKNRISIEKIKNDPKLNDQEKRIKMKAMRTEGKEARKKILTEQQLGKLETLKASRKKKTTDNN